MSSLRLESLVHPTLSSSTAWPEGTSTRLRAAEITPGPHPTALHTAQPRCPQHNPEHLTQSPSASPAPASIPHLPPPSTAPRAPHAPHCEPGQPTHPSSQHTPYGIPYIPPYTTAPGHPLHHNSRSSIPCAAPYNLPAHPKAPHTCQGIQLPKYSLCLTHPPKEHSSWSIPCSQHVPPWSTSSRYPLLPTHPSMEHPLLPTHPSMEHILLEHSLLPTHPSMEHILQVLPAPHTTHGSQLPEHPPCPTPLSMEHSSRSIPYSQHIPPRSTSSRHPLLPTHPTEHPLLPTHPSMDHSPSGTPCNPCAALAASFGAPPGAPQLPDSGRALRVAVPGARPALTALSPGPAGAPDGTSRRTSVERPGPLAHSLAHVPESGGICGGETRPSSPGAEHPDCPPAE
ncbi:PREDICTED: vegetative cell wall protein gp1-like [Ficedula albicollis]|uniref:vegetative cell wall protein gp1-like n=1 Tax=Ficedula albicollis TaxID=59894 RepID=UPI0007AD94CB|nr:PREDICTED: vegetative cell wall protein gp1-like [Ficedula albicollis]